MIAPIQIVKGYRPDRYTEKLDRHLVKLPNDASRLAFLNNEDRKWERGRADFIDMMASRHGTLESGGATIEDYNEVIFRIHDRIGLCRGRLENKAIAERVAPAKAGAGAASPAATLETV